MKKLFAVLLLALAAAATTFRPAAAQKSKVDVAAELQSLVKTEREFAKTSAAKGTRQAFLAFLADDGLLFRPAPVNGKKFLNERPDRPGLLTWEPTFADVSRAGDLGYTTGPWEFREKSAGERPVGHGQFMTIWGKQPDGSWKFLLDVGTSHPAPANAPPSLSFSPDFRKNKPEDKLSVDTEPVEKNLLKMEREFSKAAAAGAAAAFDARAADDLRLLRNDIFPATSKQAAMKILTSSPDTLTWEPLAARASRSGELGYTYGTYERRANAADGKPTSERGHYVHIWKKKPDGKWRLVLHLLNPLPPPQPAS